MTRDETMIQLYEAGATQAAIAKKFGLTQSGVGRILRRSGVKTRHSGPTALPAEERFWRHVDKRGLKECWLWTGAKTGRYGHGSFAEVIGGSPVRAHRFAWRLKFGEIPKGKCVLHTCDEYACVNWRHLFLGTRKDNADDRDAKGRTARGDRIGSAKLTVKEVRALRRKASRGESLLLLAHGYGVSFSTVNDIVSRRTWKWVD